MTTTTRYRAEGLDPDEEIAKLDPGDSIESIYESEPDCPLCGRSICLSDYELYGDGESEEIECGGCENTLTAVCSLSLDYQLTYRKPTQADHERSFARACESVRRELARRRAWEESRPQREREAKRLEGVKARWPSWDAWTWPDWVPDDQRENIESRHSRGPWEYAEGMRREQAPATGARITLARGTCHEVTGRFLFAWGNMARLVRDGGNVSYCYLGRGGAVYLSCHRDHSSPDTATAMPGASYRVTG